MGELTEVVANGGSGTGVEVIPWDGVVFTGWSDGVTDNPRTDTNVTSGIDVVAEFDFGDFDCDGNIIFNYKGTIVTYGMVENEGGDCWLDRDLGADPMPFEPKDAIDRRDERLFGDIYQWGRLADGHEERDSNLSD